MENDNKLKYVEIQPRARAELETAFASGDENTICDALFSAAQHESDWRWSQTQCLAMLKHNSVMVRSSALMAIGEIAIFRGEIDLDIVLPELERFSNDPTLSECAKDAMDDVLRVFGGTSN